MAARAFCLVLLLACASSRAGTPADAAYRALREGRLDEAVAQFRLAVQSGPVSASVHKDFAYALLRTGDREEALEQFESALALDASDERASLEFAFLAYELKREREARRVFARLRGSPDAAIAKTAADAFENVDRPLREGIARWQAALAAAPGQWSAHEEFAGLAFQRDEFPLAEEHYREALRLKPDKRELMLELALVLRAAGREREALALLLALSRGGEPRLAERARRLWPGRYPFVYEFDDAIAADPSNDALKAERDELLIAMGIKRPAPPDAKQMGLKSLEKSYLNDALRYLRIAREEHPGDAEVALKLGYTYNLLRRDKEALQAFALARDLGSGEGGRAYRALRAANAKFSLQAWALPVFSSRWDDLFVYGQVRGEWKLGRVRPYASLRVNGDVRGSLPGAFGPLYLSENAAIAAAGIGLPWKHGVYFWGEAGQSFGRGGSRPDYRGGVSFLRQWRLPGAAFHEAALDGVFLSRFGNDLITYAQNRTGWKLLRNDQGARIEAYWNGNLTFDAKRQAWANFAEFGPGVRVRLPGMPPAMSVRVDWVRGVYLINRGNIQRPNFWDARAGVWYAFAR